VLTSPSGCNTASLSRMGEGSWSRMKTSLSVHC